MFSYLYLSRKFFIEFFQKHYVLIFFLLLFSLHLFLQFYKPDYFITFGWDQTDNAWAAKHIIVDHRYPLVGMVAKANSGFNTGPLYYYYIAFFYWLFNLNPLASPVSAGVVSIMTFLAFFFLTRKLVSTRIALITVFIETCSFFIILNDRSQWPVALIPTISLIIFYALYKIVLGKEKFLFLLAVALGLSIHIHFTSVFYYLIVFLTLPFFPRKKSTVLWGIGSFLVLLCFFIPNLVYEMRTTHSQSVGMMSYFHTYYHGVHLTRFLQLTHDAFIEFDLLFRNSITSLLSFAFLPLFCIIYLCKEKGKKKFLFCYLINLWFVIPWFAFSTYSGEISNYYFFMTRPFVLIILSYLTYFIYSIKKNYLKIVIICFWIYFAFINISEFFNYSNHDSLSSQLKDAKIEVQNGIKVKSEQNVPEQYFLYYLLRKGK